MKILRMKRAKFFYIALLGSLQIQKLRHNSPFVSFTSSSTPSKSDLSSWQYFTSFMNSGAK